MDGEYHRNERRVPIVQMIFDLAESGIGAHGIAKILNGNPATPPFEHMNGKPGKKWHPTTIANILTGRHVLGWYQPCRVVDGRQEPVGDPVQRYPAIISEAQWHRVQARRKTNPRGNRGETMSNLFTGLLRCGRCGGVMKVKTSYATKKRPGKDHRYFVCTSAMMNSGCEANTHYPIEQVEKAILDHTPEYRLHELFSDPGTAQQLKALDDQITDLKRKFEDTERRKANAIDRAESLPQGDPLIIEYETRARTYSADLRASHEALKALEIQKVALATRIDERADSEGKARELRAKIAEAEGKELLKLRASLSQALRTFIDELWFRGEMFTVVLHGAGKVHHFQVVNGKGRAAGRTVEYAGATYWNNDEMRRVVLG
nr:recombinase zinc beta ribbon domain-containing protein [Microvirga mediterraneensis]